MSKLRSFRFSSVGSKLAGATIALILVATAGSYLKVSGSERGNLLRSKEIAASAVTRLFADSCEAAVIFDDDKAVKDALTTLGRNDEVEYAGVWSVDPAGRVIRRLGELRRGLGATVTETPPAIQLRREKDRVVVTAPVKDSDGKSVAVGVVTFALGRENRAIAEAQRTTLLVSITMALGIVLLLMAMARLVIVGPLGKLVIAAKELEEGGTANIDITTTDEVGQLAHAFRSMAGAIKVRERRINVNNRDMRFLLDNVGQGFITLGNDGEMSDERSRVIDDWFGAATGSKKFWDYLMRIDPSVAEGFQMGWEAIAEDVLPLDLCLAQLPSLARKGGRTFELVYRPVMEGDRLDKTIVVITDVTERIERDHAEQTQREMMSLFRRTISDRVALDGFFGETTTLITAVTGPDSADLSVIRRQVHTIKGNCALFGIESVAEFCHGVESRMEQSAEAMSDAEKATMVGLWAKVNEMRARLTDDGRAGGVEVDQDDFAAFVSDLHGHVAHDVLVATVASWRFEPASKRLKLLDEQLRALALRLGKVVEVIRAPTILRLPPDKWAPFWSAFAHVIRNTVDHGVEPPAERTASGKVPHGTVTLGVSREDGQVVVSITDDGPGIDWSRITTRAEERGLPFTTPDEVQEALFVAGISSRSDVTSTSGRGVGLSAVRAAVQALGGHIEVTTQTGGGTRFRFVFPESMLFEEPVSFDSEAAGTAILTARAQSHLRVVGA